MDDETGERIREARVARRMSQGELAAAVGVSNSYLSHIEAGRRPASGSILEHLAAALGMETQALQDGVPSDRKDEARLKLSFGEMALRNGDWEVARQAFAEALRYARALPLERFSDEARWGLARALEAVGRLEEAIAEYEGLLHQDRLSAGVSRAAVQVTLLRAYNEAGDLARAVDVGEQALREPGTPRVDFDSRVELISTLAGCYVERGDLARASVLMREGLEIADRHGSLRARAAAAWEAAVVEEVRHNYVDAGIHAGKALALYQELDSQRAVGLLHVVSAGILLRQEGAEPETAMTLLDRAESELATSGTELDLAYVGTERARAQLISGAADLAIATARQALEAMADGDRLQRGRVHLLMGHAARALGRDDEALAAFRSAADHLRDAGAVRQAAKAWRELGEAYSDLGQPDDAIAAFREASDLAGITVSHPWLGAAVGQPVSQ